MPSALLAGPAEQARKIAGEYLDIFGTDRFFIEVQNQGIAEQDQVNPHAGRRWPANWAWAWWAPTTCTSSAASDKPAHEVLTCISTGKTLADGGALSVLAGAVPQEPRRDARRPWRPGPRRPTTRSRIAEMCDAEAGLQAQAPAASSPRPTARRPTSYLRKLGLGGPGAAIRRRAVPEDYAQRLDWELKVIEDKGYSSLLPDRQRLRPVRPATTASRPAPRGSGVATLLGYVLGICRRGPDPLRPALRAVHRPAARRRCPTIDIDICQEGRAQGHPVRPPEVRPRGADHHLRNAQGPGGHPRRRPRAGHAAGRSGRHRQEGARGAER